MRDPDKFIKRNNMRLSSLQKFILIKCFNSRGFRVNRIGFLAFYGQGGSAKAELHTKIITRSIETLIDRELMTGYGVRTAHKWFIREVSLTNQGKRLAKKMSGEQLKFKFRK